MTKIVDLNLKAVVQSREAASDLVSAPGDAVIISRGRPRWLLLGCPCGCGDTLPVNLDARAGAAWKMYESKKGLDIYPSVWRDTGCESHFIVRRGKIWLFQKYDEDAIFDYQPEISKALVAMVEKALTAEAKSFVDIADALGEVPWNVLDACRLLSREGFAVEGRGDARGSFSLKPLGTSS